MTATAAPRGRSSTRAITYAWVVLSAITVLSWWLAPGQHPERPVDPSVPITVAVVVLGFIKGRMIIAYFMEVRTAPRWLKIATDAWLFVLWAAILAIYLY
ncbi:prokaryotic cytochrome C oxidase subunit IV family protein [Mycolicibacterium agri]|uniref:Prokaryotic cytochrome C oxidase subunit IV family protein n=1 Tax=Mycolicibacterium agri TaxID=36811 RepID=A0A2A7NFV6_MYCAG|nr:cytochrome C oxidase subunit IV family protein [Mycolicibacterium agri]PEG42321.1 prokaryotic cytochrome C oxidase subunit IV family protein [Mycolicibacterium agri]GFG51177.1 prokaryotic cytochrome C oxidase subunit IV family protein [Mycolicibacterium agri]